MEVRRFLEQSARYERLEADADVYRRIEFAVRADDEPGAATGGAPTLRYAGWAVDDRDARRCSALGAATAAVQPRRSLVPRGLDRYYREMPVHWLAPMVDQSELPFRMMCRRYGAQVCYTPMLEADRVLTQPVYLRRRFSTCAADRPLVAQLCGRDPQSMLRAAQLLEPLVDAIDINLGCPQDYAERKRVGAFLMDELPLVERLVRTLVAGLRVPVYAKIRKFASHGATLDYVRMLHAAGISALVVHARARDHQTRGLRRCFVPADWALLRKIRELELTPPLPIIGNGNVQCYQDVERCMRETGCDGVMVALSALENPAFFAGGGSGGGGGAVDCFQLAFEYLQQCAQYPPVPTEWVRQHLSMILRVPLLEHRAEFAPRLQPTTEFAHIPGTLERAKQQQQQQQQEQLPPPTEELDEAPPSRQDVFFEALAEQWQLVFELKQACALAAKRRHHAHAERQAPDEHLRRTTSYGALLTPAGALATNMLFVDRYQY